MSFKIDNLDTEKPSIVPVAGAGAAAPLPDTINDGPAVVTADTLRNGFDPLVHQVGANGEPLLSANGTFRRKPGRKPGAKPSTAPGIPATDAPAPVAKSPTEKRAARAASDELARAVLATSVGTMIALVGPEWDFQNQAEADGMKAAVSAYIEAKGDGQLTPEAMLLLVVAGYALPRAAHENTRSKFEGFFSGLWNGLKSIFRR
jgi:hypothetical protein